MSRLFAAAALLLGALGSATSARAQCGACPFPCSNSGTCVNDVCDCTPGFAGDCCGSLLFCLPPCLSCDQEDGCLQCENGYDLIGGDCVPTFGNCCVSCNCFEVSEQECADMEGIFGTLGNRCANTICFDNVDPEITCPADIELCEEGANTGQSMTSDDCDQDVLVTIVDDLTTCLATPGGDPN
jgi:hypothetical protein